MIEEGGKGGQVACDDSAKPPFAAGAAVGMPLGTTHPLDADGASSHLYYYLAKEHFRGSCQSAQLESARVHLPGTVLFEQGFAKSWFYSLKSPEVASVDGLPDVQLKKKLGRDIENEQVFDSFSKSVKDENDLAATFISYQKKDIGDPGLGGTVVQYLSRKQLRTFLFSPGQKPKGVLQKFSPPKGSSNSTIKAVWSPAVVIVKGWRNPHSIYQYSRTPWERGTTFETPDATEIVLTPSVTAGVRATCKHIVQHLYLIEHIKIVSMVLVFKLDCTDKLNFLYSLSMRVATSSS
ncbi:hypothetical protein DIPPA_19880, partial [Diplonema papillatum]